MTRRDDCPAHGCAGPYIQGRSGLPAYQPAEDASASQGLRHSRQEGHARVADGRIQPAQSSDGGTCVNGLSMGRLLPDSERPGVEPATFKSQAQRSNNNYTTRPDDERGENR